MPTTSDKAREPMLQAILSRAASDSVFRAKLLDQPKVAIAEAFGVNIPARFQVQFIEKSADLDALIVLPDLRVESEELSDGDLAAVNGGTDLFSFDTAW
jgi:hypothetical protein